MKNAHLPISLIGISILVLSFGSAISQDDGALIIDFPTFVAGAGNRTDFYITAICEAADPQPTIEVRFLDNKGAFIHTVAEQGICNRTLVLPFAGGADGHAQVLINSPTRDGVLVELVELNQPGAAPIGVPFTEPCQDATFTVIRDQKIDTGVAVSSLSPDPIACVSTTWSADSTLVGDGTFTVPSFGQNQFFVFEKTPLPDNFKGWGKVTCDGEVTILSFFQTNLGGLTTNPVQCDTEE